MGRPRPRNDGPDQQLVIDFLTLVDLGILIHGGAGGHDTSLIRAALRCFRNCNFGTADHDFLEGSQVLSSIGQIERAASSDSRMQTSVVEIPTSGKTMECAQWAKGIEFDVQTSSNGPMAAAVFEESTESFWEADAQHKW